MENSKEKIHAIVIPYPYQGHVTPMVNLSIKLAQTGGFTITFIQTEFIHHSISKAVTIDDDFDMFAEARKSGLDIRYATISDGFPIEFDRDLNFDEYWETMFTDFPDRVDEIVQTTINEQDSSSKVLLIADTVYTWPAKTAKKYNIVNVSLWTEPATLFSINYHLDLLHQNGHFPYKGNCESSNIITYIPGVESISTRDLMTYVQDPDMIPTLTRIVIKGFEQVKDADFILCNTVQELESQAMSMLNGIHPTYAIGPMNFYSHFTKISITKSLWSESDCTHWLNTKPRGSVLYISFGSIAQSNKQDIQELANGLLQSGVYFVWVLRNDIVGGGNQSNFLPLGFENLIKDRGLIVPWCNQNMVLSNEATGGFLTHCGWNSVLESMWHGVPMICYPFLVDQPTNRKLVVDDWKIGINLCDGVDNKVRREEVANKISILTMGEKSIQMKHEMKEVSKKLRDSLGEDGSSMRNFDQFVDDLKAKLARMDGKPIIHSLNKWD